MAIKRLFRFLAFFSGVGAALVLLPGVLKFAGPDELFIIFVVVILLEAVVCLIWALKSKDQTDVRRSEIIFSDLSQQDDCAKD